VIAQVLVAKRDAGDPLQQQGFDRVLDKGR